MKLKNMNVVTCPPCGESTRKGGKGVVNKGVLFDNPPSALRATSKAEILFDNPPTPLRGTSPARGAEKEALRAKHPASGEVNGGFTLIELLVVVLIIGILAAVALPQYRKAVTRAHYAELQALVKSIYQAEQVYHLANGTYTVDFADLDIEISNISNGRTVRYFRGNNACLLEESYLYCKNNDINMSYRMDYAGERACVAYNANDTVAHSICKAETGRSGPSEGYSSTYFYP